MKDKRIVVALKYCKGELNPFDGAALECALQSGAKEIIAVSMAPMSALNAFQGLTRLGVRCVLISDPAYAGSDTQATSVVLAKAIDRLRPDLIFCGRQSVDGDTAQVPPMLAQRLGFRIYTKVAAMDETQNGLRMILRSGERIAPENGTIFTFERFKTLRFPSIFSRLGEVEIWDNSVLQIPLEKCGLDGSTTRVIKSYESNVGRRFCRFVGAAELDGLIKAGLLKANETNATETGGKLSEVYFVGDVESVAKNVADTAIPLNVAGQTPEDIAKELVAKSVKTVLWEDSDALKTLAARVAVLTDAGLCADCISFRVDDGQFIMTRPAFGGNITADIVNTGKIAFATVRTVKKGGNELVFTVGKGGAACLDKIKALAARYGAEVCASRIVVDSGKMPYETQVGLTGKSVSPKVYVAFGVSGAVQHTCAIAGAGTVIAVNVDKDARIFDCADYGIVEDIEKI